MKASGVGSMFLSVLLFGVVASLLPLGNVAFAQGGGPRSWGFCPMTGMMSGTMGWIGAVFMLLFWGFVLFGIFALISWLWRRGDSTDLATRETPFDVLKRRYARGEISKEQYESMRRELEVT